MVSPLTAVRKMLERERRKRAEEIAAVAAEEIEVTTGIILYDYVGAEDASRVGEDVKAAIYDAFMQKN